MEALDKALLNLSTPVMSLSNGVHRERKSH